jgi:hypothetical protein
MNWPAVVVLIIVVGLGWVAAYSTGYRDGQLKQLERAQRAVAQADSAMEGWTRSTNNTTEAIRQINELAADLKLAHAELAFIKQTGTYRDDQM